MRPLQELLNEDLDVYAVNGHAIPYYGWVELTINLTGNDDSNLTIQASFLVNQLSLAQPLLGANVLEKIIKQQETSGDAITTVISLLCSTFRMEEEQVVAMVNFIQVPQKTNPATLRVGKDNVTIPARKAGHVWCRVPSNFDTSNPLVLYEPTQGKHHFGTAECRRRTP